MDTWAVVNTPHSPTPLHHTHSDYCVSIHYEGFAILVHSFLDLLLWLSGFRRTEKDRARIHPLKLYRIPLEAAASVTCLIAAPKASSFCPEVPLLQLQSKPKVNYSLCESPPKDCFFPFPLVSHIIALCMVPKLSILTSMSVRIWGDYKVPSSPISDLTDTFHKVSLLFSSLTMHPPPTINFSALEKEESLFSLLISPYVHFLLFPLSPY